MINERYEVIKSIGEGGMANVYLAKDTILDRDVAVKVLRGDLSNDDKFIRRFEREALSVSKLSHPNIVEVYDVGEENEQHYIVMEYIDGKTLKQLLYKRNTLTVEEVIDIMTQLTDAIAHAHESYIIHRDIKPQNIMILDDGSIKVTDFGIAIAMNATQLTQTNSVMGSVHYIPPEQANGKSATIKSDIYSIGIMMYELLTGSVPFKGDNAVEIAIKHMKEKIPSIRKQNPAIYQSVENIVLKATAKNPRNRYENARDMCNDLKECLSEEHKDDKRHIYEYPENDLDQTKVMTAVDVKKESKKAITPIERNEDEEPVEKKSHKTLFIILGFILVMLITVGIFWLVITNSSPKDIKVPDVSGLEVNEAISQLEELGFKYTTVSKKSKEIDEGYVIKTSPAAGSTKVKGSTITIYESAGQEYYILKDLTNENINKIQAKLELLGITVDIQKKDVEEPEEYIGKEDIIIDQEPKFDKEKEIRLVEGDTITLYVPNIVNEYPDMVNEGWTLDQVKEFAEVYGISLTVEFVDENNKKVEIEDDTNYGSNIVVYQSRTVGDPIVNGIPLKVRIYVEVEDDTLEDSGLLPSEDEDTTSTN